MSKFFSLKELTASKVAEDNGIDNTPGAVEMENLGYLANALLDAVREMWGKPLTITSGYRCHALNQLVGGVRNSQHTKGMAADITTGSPADNQKLFRMIEESNLQFDQLIDEKNYQWLHLSYNPRGCRHETLHL